MIFNAWFSSVGWIDTLAMLWTGRGGMNAFYDVHTSVSESSRFFCGFLGFCGFPGKEDNCMERLMSEGSYEE